MFELDFESNPTDIINSEHHEFDEYSVGRLAREYTSEYRRSLRVSFAIFTIQLFLNLINFVEKWSKSFTCLFPVLFHSLNQSEFIELNKFN